MLDRIKHLEPHGTDVGLILFAALASAVAYIGHIGFYSDDWAFLFKMASAPDQSAAGIYNALAQAPHVAVRPGQIALYVFIHTALRDSAVAGQIFNHAVFAGAMVVLFAALKRLVSRNDALAITVIYACMAVFCTTRFWFASYQANAALFAFAASLWFLASAESATGWRQLAAIVAAALFFVVGGFCYELFMPLNLLAPVAIVFLRPRDARRRRYLVLCGVVLGVTAAGLVAFKLSLMFAVHQHYGLLQTAYRAGAMYWHVGLATFVTLGLAAPVLAARSLIGGFFSSAALACGLIAALVLWRASRRLVAEAPSERDGYIRMLVVGVLAFLAGYAVLFENFYVGYSALGVDNRTNIAGAFGAAMMFYAAFRLIARAGYPVLARACFAALCGCGLYFQALAGAAWAQAWRTEEQVHRGLLQALGPLSDGDTVLLHGVCPYYGPAPLYTSNWGLAEQLQLERRVRHIKADTIAVGAGFNDKGIIISEYEEPTLYPYRDMRIYAAAEGRLYGIRDRADAARFFARHSLASPCNYSDGAGRSVWGQVPLLR